MRIILILLLVSLAFSCDRREITSAPMPDARYDPDEIFGYYSKPEAEMMYSEFVADSFRIFSSVPDKYDRDTMSNYPLILILDANAYMESIVAELKLGRLTQGLPEAIIVGIGYKDFWTMDSLRNRDYTYPQALPEDEFPVSGGADKFTKFIDNELLPRLSKKFRFNPEQVVIMGHSLGGYFVLYYFFDAARSGNGKIQNFIAASPALSYGHGYLSGLATQGLMRKESRWIKLYVSQGSLERDPQEKENQFDSLRKQMETTHESQFKAKFVELGNFDHMDAAIPGMMKGLVFALTKPEDED